MPHIDHPATVSVYSVASRGVGQGGLVPRGPGQLWGPGPIKLVFFLFFFVIGS